MHSFSGYKYFQIHEIWLYLFNAHNSSLCFILHTLKCFYNSLCSTNYIFLLKILWDSFCRSNDLLDKRGSFSYQLCFQSMWGLEAKGRGAFGQVGIWHMENTRWKMGCTEGVPWGNILEDIVFHVSSRQSL